MNTIKEVKTVVKALRKEFSELKKPAAELSHNETLELVARALGHASWGAMRATLEPGEPVDKAVTADADAAQAPIEVRGFLPYYGTAPVGKAPAYRHDNLLVSLQFHPGLGSRDGDKYTLDLSELNAEGEGLEDCQIWMYSDLDPNQPNATEVGGAYVKAVAELVQPYLSDNLGLQAMGPALSGLGKSENGLTVCRDALAALATDSRAADEIPQGELGTLVTLGGEAIIGTLEEVKGHAKLEGARRNSDGTLELEYVGETVIWWDDARTQYNDKGETLYVTLSYSVVPESQVKLLDSSNKLTASEMPKIY